VRCGACGYAREDHDPTGHCPLCACGATPAEHLLAWAVPPPMLKASTEARCPNREQRESGKWLTMRRGSFRPPEPMPRLRELYHGIMVIAESEFVPTPGVAYAPPRVAARDTYALSEIAPRATPVGSLAADLGWAVRPMYWMDAEGTETSALLMHRGALRAVAYWSRAEGGRWKTGGARAWRDGSWPREVGVTALARLIEEMGRDDHQEG
jgi:hypothetical protein